MLPLANHYSELREAFDAARPYLVGSLVISSLLVVLAVIDPGVVRLGPLERLSHRRSELVVLGVLVPLSVFLAAFIVFWAL